MNVQSTEKNPYFQNPLIAPIIHFHGRLISTFDDLPENGKVVEIAIRIAVIVVSPLAYLALGISSLVGLACHSLFEANDSQGLGSASQSATASVVCNIPEQQMQDEDLKKWNDEFKNIVKGDPNLIKEKLRSHRIPLYQKTKDVCERGFFVQNRLIKLDEKLKEKMVQNTQLYSPDALPPMTCQPLATVFEVVDQDTIDLTKQYQEANLKPVALNLANAYIPGGGVETGDGAQEESLFRRSNYYQALCPRKKDSKNPLYPIVENGVIYTPDVQIFRTGEPDYTKTIKETDSAYEFHIPYSVSFIAAAHMELNRSSKINEVKNLDGELSISLSNDTRIKLEKICDGIIKELGIEGSYEQVSKAKMRAILRTACLPDEHGQARHDSLVLGALGCGAFGNPRNLNAIYWKEVFQEQEFQGRFKKVGFAIRSFGSQHLINSFKKTIETLNSNLKSID